MPNRLVTAVLHLGKPTLESLWETPDGKLRLVEVSWREKEFAPVPPKEWDKMAETEMSVQDGEALARAQGRSIEPPRGIK